MNKKKGISLIILTITIIVLSIISTIVVINTQDSIDNANKVTFAEELRNILDAANVYYLENGSYPISETYTKEEFLNLATTEKRQALQNEVTLNNDESDTYFKIDLNLIRSSGGLFADFAEEYNVYVINDDATNIYYPMGFEVEGEMYYSLSSKLTDMNKNSSNNEHESVILNNTTDSIKAVKNTEKWTNNLKITVTTTLNTEQLYYTIGGVETEITENLPYELELSINILNEEQIENIKTNPFIYFTKKINGSISARTIVEISNLDLTAPILNSLPVVTTNTEYNMVKFLDQTEDESGVIASYYVVEENEMTAEQIVSTGIKAEGTFIKLDKSITSIQMVLVDGAGNISEVIDVTISG